jgi:hypothetical protein
VYSLIEYSGKFEQLGIQSEKWVKEGDDTVCGVDTFDEQDDENDDLHSD